MYLIYLLCHRHLTDTQNKQTSSSALLLSTVLLYLSVTTTVNSSKISNMNHVHSGGNERHINCLRYTKIATAPYTMNLKKKWRKKTNSVRFIWIVSFCCVFQQILKCNANIILNIIRSIRRETSLYKKKITWICGALHILFKTQSTNSVDEHITSQRIGTLPQFTTTHSMSCLWYVQCPSPNKMYARTHYMCKVKC